MKTETENFIRQINEMKQAGSLDLSSGEDLSIALMNLVSLEEHFLFSFMKTGDRKFLGFLEQARELRKKLLGRIVRKDKDDDSEKWCISKHLLATAMRLSEVGTKFLREKKQDAAEEMFTEAFNAYAMFWQVNGLQANGAFSAGKGAYNSAKAGENLGKMSKISLLLKKVLNCCRE